MKQIVQRMKSFIAFDFRLQLDTISAQFTSIHTYYQSKIPNWSLKATRKRVVADFWLQHVLRHFAVILIMAIIVSIPFGVNWKILRPVVLACGCLTFLILTIFNYGPIFYSQFLPRLEAVVAEQEKLFAVPPAPIIIPATAPKCKREQYPIPTLKTPQNRYDNSRQLPPIQKLSYPVYCPFH